MITYENLRLFQAKCIHKNQFLPKFATNIVIAYARSLLKDTLFI
jgi:hypothetical protein